MATYVTSKVMRSFDVFPQRNTTNGLKRHSFPTYSSNRHEKNCKGLQQIFKKLCYVQGNFEKQFVKLEKQLFFKNNSKRMKFFLFTLQCGIDTVVVQSIRFSIGNGGFRACIVHS